MLLFEVVAQPLPDLTPLSKITDLSFWSQLLTLAAVGLGVFFWARGEFLGKKSPATAEVEDKVTHDPILEAYFNFAAQLRTITELLQVIKSSQELNKLEYQTSLGGALAASRHSLIEKLSDVQAELGEKIDGGHEHVMVMRDFLVRMEERDRQVLQDLASRDRASSDRDRAMENALNSLANTIAHLQRK